MLEELKIRVCDANLELVESGLVCLTWGNASAIDRDRNLVVIKPSGVSYSEMQPGDMVVVDLDGKVVEGSLKPSTDTPSHLELYKAWPGPGGIIHTHSTHATMFAQACRGIPCFGTTHADHFYGEVPVTRVLEKDEVMQDYEGNTGKVIVERFRDIDPMAVPGVVVANHAPFAWGRDIGDAVKNAIALEEIARMAVGTMSVNSSVAAIPQYILDKHYSRKHGPSAYYGQ